MAQGRCVGRCGPWFGGWGRWGGMVLCRVTVSCRALRAQGGRLRGVGGRVAGVRDWGRWGGMVLCRVTASCRALRAQSSWLRGAGARARFAGAGGFGWRGRWAVYVAGARPSTSFVVARAQKPPDCVRGRAVVAWEVGGARMRVNWWIGAGFGPIRRKAAPIHHWHESSGGAPRHRPCDGAGPQRPPPSAQPAAFGVRATTKRGRTAKHPPCKPPTAPAPPPPQPTRNHTTGPRPRSAYPAALGPQGPRRDRHPAKHHAAPPRQRASPARHLTPPAAPSTPDRRQ